MFLNILKKYSSVGLLLITLGFLPSCDLSPSYQTTDDSTIPSNFTPVSYSKLSGWDNDDVRYALQAFRNSCDANIQFTGKLIPDAGLFREKCDILPSPSADVKTVRAWFEDHFQPYAIENDNGGDTGLFTGYYSPVIPACRTKTPECNEPLMGVPTDGRNYKGVSKTDIVNNKIGNVLYWANMVDVQNIQIQGSGMLELENGEMVKLNFAAVNDLPFKSIGEYLRTRGIRPDNGYSADAVWQHLKKNPTLARNAIYANPRYVYFSVADKDDVIGKIGTPLSKIRSIAMDDSLYTIGMPVYVDTHLSDGRKFQRLMIAQDTGSAIRGWVRGDIFFGTGASAYKYAQGQHSNGRAYILMPKEYVNAETK